MRFIWATRGQSWGFKFLRDGGFEDPLPIHEVAMTALGDGSDSCYRVPASRKLPEMVALRLLDPLGRRDASGRPIPHEFVIFEDREREVQSAQDGLRLVWSQVADEYADIWKRQS